MRPSDAADQVDELKAELDRYRTVIQRCLLEIKADGDAEEQDAVAVLTIFERDFKEILGANRPGPPTPEPFIGYKCPRCPSWSTDPDVALHHCDCPIDGCIQSRYRNNCYYTHCEEHVDEHRAKAEAERIAKLTPLDPADGFDLTKCDMFYCDNLDRFSTEIEDLIDHCLDDDIPAADIVIQPCPKPHVGTPDIAETVDEAWAVDFTDDSYDGLDLTAETSELMEKLQAALNLEAPAIYYPSRHRIILDTLLPESAGA